MWQPSVLLSLFLRHTQSPKIVGHIAENCSSEQRLCYNCRQPGHESSACPSPRTVSAKQCYSCGGVGHIQGISLFQIVKMLPAQLYFTAECPTLRVQQGGNQKCYVRSSFQKKDITQFTNAFRIVDASVILLAIAKMAQPPMVVSLLVHRLQVVHSTPRLYPPLSAIAVAVPII